MTPAAAPHLTSRKFILAMVGLISIVALAWAEKIDAGVFATCFVALVGAYFTANVAQKRLADPKAAP